MRPAYTASLLFIWGTLMAAAQAIDPAVNGRSASLDTLKALGVLD